MTVLCTPKRATASAVDCDTTMTRAVAVGLDPARLEHVAAEHGHRERRVEVPALLGGLVEEGDDRGVRDPLVGAEGHRVDHVDDHVELAVAVLAYHLRASR